jgi:hypothetical protein
MREQNGKKAAMKQIQKEGNKDRTTEGKNSRKGRK